MNELNENKKRKELTNKEQKMSKIEIQKLTNQELKNEIERRIKSGEWRIETHMEDTDEPIYYKVIDSISFPVPTKEEGTTERRFLEVGGLLKEQEKRDEEEYQTEINKDNSRTEVWKKMESLMNFSFQETGAWGNSRFILTCKQCGLELKHIYINQAKWRDTKNFRVSGILSMVEYEWERHLLQGHGRPYSSGWTEELKKFPEYDEWLKTKNKGLLEARWKNKN